MPGSVEIIAHRGAPRELTENTLPSFRRALELGADGIELDVHATQDGEVVVHHDPTPRASAGNGALAGRPIASLTLAELRTLRVDGTPIPTLVEVLDLVRARATVYVEVKDAAAALPTAALLEEREAWTAIHAFDHRVPARAAAERPGLRTGVLLDSYLVDTPAAMRAAGARDLWQRWEFVDEALVHDVHAIGGRVIAWTVNDRTAAASLAAMGVDAVCTDVPGLLRATVRADAAHGSSPA
jgi:glycerophosphoryl diester phosphodiesterase